MILFEGCTGNNCYAPKSSVYGDLALSGIQVGAINRYLSLASNRKTEKSEMVFKVPWDKVWGMRGVYLIDPVGSSGI